MMLSILRSLVWIWPFVSEMFFAGKPFKTILREHWGLALLLALLSLSLLLNYLGAVKIYKITSSNIPPPASAASATRPSKNGADDDVQEMKEKLQRIYNDAGVQR